MELRHYQQASIDCLRNGFKSGHTRQILALATGGGKCHGIDTPILMADGSIKKVQNISVGDMLMGDDGTYRKVKSLAHGYGKLYKINQTKGDSYVVNDAHILSLKKSSNVKGLKLYNGLVVDEQYQIANINVEDFILSSSNAKHLMKGWFAGAVEFNRNKIELPIDPYFLGAWIGDGTSTRPSISKPMCNMVKYCCEYAISIGLDVSINNSGRCPQWSFVKKHSETKNLLLDNLRNIGVIPSKKIPELYKFSSLNERMSLIAGMLDSDGSVSRTGFDWISVSEDIANDFQFICRSIGLKCNLKMVEKGIKSIGFVGTYWRCSVFGDFSKLPLLDKIPPKRKINKNSHVNGIEIEDYGYGDYYGFEIDGNNLYCLGDFTVTHNTITSAELIKLSIAKGSKVGIFCERRKLVEQFSKTLDFLSIDHGIMMAGHWRYRPQSQVQILSIQTFARMERLPHFDIVVIDEVHAAMHKSLQKYLDARPEVKVVGLSATPFSAILPKYFTNIINPITMRELVDEGSLLPYKVFIAHEVDTDGVKVSSTGEWDVKQLGQRASVVVGDVVADYLSIGQRLHGRKTKAICFSAGIAHGKELVNRFLEVGVMAVQLTHNNNEDEKQEIFKEFDKHDSVIDVLISAEMLQRGFDNTSVEHVILAKPIRKSFSSMVQMIGRGARPHDGQSFCIIQDNGGNWMRFNDDWNKLYGDGVTELVGNGDEKTRKEKTAKEKEAAKCPVCFALWTGGLICPVCGHVKKQQAMVEEVAGEIIEFNGIVEKKEKFSSEYKEAFYQGLIGYARSKGFKDGWAWHAYQAKFNVQPTWKKVAGEITVDVMNHIKHQAIKRAKGAKK